jgi:hypothetical protein
MSDRQIFSHSFKKSFIQEWILSVLPIELKAPIEEIIKSLNDVDIESVKLILNKHKIIYEIENVKKHDDHYIKLVLDQLNIDLILVNDIFECHSSHFDIKSIYVYTDYENRIVVPVDKKCDNNLTKGPMEKITTYLMSEINFEISTEQIITIINIGLSLPIDNSLLCEKILKNIYKMTPEELCLVIPQIISYLYTPVKNRLKKNHEKLVVQRTRAMMKFSKHELKLIPCCLPDYFDIPYLFLTIFPIDETLGIKIYSLSPEKINSSIWFQLSKILVDSEKIDLIHKYKILDKITNGDAAKLIEILVEKNCYNLLTHLIDCYGVEFIKKYSNLDNLTELAKATNSDEMIDIVSFLKINYSDNYDFLDTYQIAQV